MSCSKQSACAVVEFNFYRGRHGKPIVKELAIRMPQHSRQQVWVFLPPYPESRLTAVQSERNEHIKKSGVQFEWSEGEVPYDKLEYIIRHAVVSYSLICVYGAEKSHFVSNLLKRPVIDIKQAYDQAVVEKGEQSLVFQTMCTRHFVENRKMCAINKCLTYSVFLMQYATQFKLGNAVVKGKNNAVTIESSEFVVGASSLVRPMTIPSYEPKASTVVLSNTSTGVKETVL